MWVFMMLYLFVLVGAVIGAPIMYRVMGHVAPRSRSSVVSIPQFKIPIVVSVPSMLPLVHVVAASGSASSLTLSQLAVQRGQFSRQKRLLVTAPVGVPSNLVFLPGGLESAQLFVSRHMGNMFMFPGVSRSQLVLLIQRE